MLSINKQIVAIAALTVCAAASALPTPSQIFYAENTAPGSTVTADVLAKRTQFLGAFTSSVGSFGFEQIEGVSAGQGSPITATFSGAGTPITATITGSGTVLGANEAGRFNTTIGGSQYLRVLSGPTSQFTINFNTAISAFGFYGTDIGDFEGTLKLLLTRSSDGGIDELIVHSTQAASGSLLFYGFADVNSRYSQISFSTSTGGTTGADYFGFDDFVVAVAGQIRQPTEPMPVPEPGSLALVGAALLAACWAQKSRRTA